MACMEHGLQISPDTHFRWSIKWRLELLGALRIMIETNRFSLLFNVSCLGVYFDWFSSFKTMPTHVWTDCLPK